MYQTVEDYVLSCDICQRVKVNRRQPLVPMTNMPVTEPFDIWILLVLYRALRKILMPISS